MQNPVKLQGRVQKGKQRGKRLGFPTINFPLAEKREEGIYVSEIIIREQKYKALTFIGTAKTFDEEIFQAETYVFDFDEDVYGEDVTVSLLEKIRDNQKFDSEEELMKQMKNDTMKAKEYFQKRITV